MKDNNNDMYFISKMKIITRMKMKIINKMIMKMKMMKM